VFVITRASVAGLVLGVLTLPPARPAPAQGRPASTAPTAARWAVHELTLTSRRAYANPYTEVAVTATFRGPGGETRTVAGFWDGDSTWRVRFTPTREGVWSYTTHSADPGLDTHTGTLRAAAAPPGARGFVRRDPAHPYHFIYDDGSRYFMLGTTYYELVANAAAGSGWKAAVEGTARRGMNKIRLNVGPGSASAGGANYPNSSPYGRSHDELNLDHWRTLDEAVRYMHDRGVVADLILFWNHESSYGTPAQDERYARYVVARYAAYPNVIWCLTNEWNYTKKPREYWNRMGPIVRGADPWAQEGPLRRGLSIHQQTRIDFQFFDQSWLSHAIVQLGVRNGQATQADEWGRDTTNKVKYVHGDDWGNASILFNHGHDMPVVNDEYGYIGEPKDRSAGDVPFTREKHRRTLWGIYMAGGYASAGDKHMYQNPPGRPYFSADWHDIPEYDDVQHLAGFFTTKGIEYWRMASRNAAVKRGTRVYVLAEPGRQYVAYAAVGGAFSLALAPGQYAARRFDPRTGESVEMERVQSDGVRPHRFDVPAGADWVVSLRAVGPDR